jgi:hypothetical protein
MIKNKTLEENIENYFSKIISKYASLPNKVEVEVSDFNATIYITIKEKVPTFVESAYGLSIFFVKDSQDIELTFSGKIREPKSVAEYAEFMQLVIELQTALVKINAHLSLFVLQNSK